MECASTHSSEALTRPLWRASIKTENHHTFFVRMVEETIASLLEGEYIRFDAQTTSNCCHGLSVLARELILKGLSLPLRTIQQALPSLSTEELLSLPHPLHDLVSLYVLTLIIEIDPYRGRRTAPLKLQQKGSLGTSFCKKIIKKLQRSFSNCVAERYAQLSTAATNHWMGDIPISTWKQYVQAPYVRTDCRGIRYVSCLFSMQTTLHYLSQTQAIVALVNDLMDPYTLTIKGRYLTFLQSGDRGEFLPIDAETLEENSVEPVIVFGGYVFSKRLNVNLLTHRMQPWTYRFPSLILACDTHYPQFPNVLNDPSFDASPIQPKESILQQCIDTHSQIQGVSAMDPTLFCLSHIFVANGKSLILSTKTPQRSVIPPCYLPCPITQSYLDTYQTQCLSSCT